tara:strand:- start:2388 stop:3377 length:990 start_codon:yes stop_codon:yes gene_type:complete
MRLIALILILSGSALSTFAQSGPFHPGVGIAGSNAVYMDSNIVYGWAQNCTVIRGYENIATPSTLASAGLENQAEGKADGTIVSLGDSGIALYTLAEPLSDHNGYDFAVFENGFYSPLEEGYFLELAFVEVSSDGTNYYRFPATSLTDTSTQVDPYGVMDPTYVNNLAGKYQSGYGVPFDLSELDSITTLDLQAITHIRIVDVVGAIDTAYAQRDKDGRPVNDPWPTEWASSGFDLDALAFLDESIVGVEETKDAIQLSFYPNPVKDHLTIQAQKRVQVSCYHLETGQLIYTERMSGNQTINVSTWPKGVYAVVVEDNHQKITKKLVVW